MNEQKNTKTLSEMTEREILRQQLELLAERSKSCLDEELVRISSAMVSIYITLENSF